MQTRAGSLGLAILAGWLIGQSPSVAQSDRTTVAFRNVTVVPMDTNRALPARTVIVGGSTIAAIGPTRTTRVPGEATQIEDLVLLDANPLQDLANFKRISGVMVRGRWFSSTAIRQELAAIRARPGNYQR